MIIEDRKLGARVSDEMIERARRMVNVWYPAKPNNEEASADAIRHWCYGLGEANPLYVDEEYAGKTSYGCIIAPPTFLTTCFGGPYYPYDPEYEIPPEKRVKGSNFPGIGALYAGDDWEFYKVVKAGDRIRAETALVEVRERPSTFAGRTVEQIAEKRFYDQDGDLVAKSWGHNFRMDRSAGRGGTKYQQFSRHKYAPEELQKIEEAYLTEERWGAKPRYWEDVRIGDSMGHVVKGPLTISSVFCFLMGWAGSIFMMAHEIAHAYLRDHPAAGIPDPQTNVPDFPERIHWDDVMARNVGVAVAFDIGPQRVAWFDHLCCNWKGDDGFLKYLSVQVRMPNIMGDTTWIKGSVVGKYVENGDHLVECELWGENQRKVIHSRGRAIIVLPFRKAAAREGL